MTSFIVHMIWRVVKCCRVVASNLTRQKAAIKILLFSMLLHIDILFEKQYLDVKFFIAVSKLRNILFNLTNLNGKYLYMQYLLFVYSNYIAWSYCASNCFGETHFFQSQILIESLIEFIILLHCIQIMKVHWKRNDMQIGCNICSVILEI